MSRREDEPEEPRTLVLGLGALGSKIALHRGRGGDDAMTLVDDDSISPHNLVRHALLRAALGRNKVGATRDKIGQVFQGGLEHTRLRALKRNAFDLLAAGPEGELAGYGLLLDFAVSKSVLQALVHATLPEDMRVVRGEIADRGQFGCWMVEGSTRILRKQVERLQWSISSTAWRVPGTSIPISSKSGAWSDLRNVLLHSGSIQIALVRVVFPR